MDDGVLFPSPFISVNTSIKEDHMHEIIPAVTEHDVLLPLLTLEAIAILPTSLLWVVLLVTFLV